MKDDKIKDIAIKILKMMKSGRGLGREFSKLEHHDGKIIHSRNDEISEYSRSACGANIEMPLSHSEVNLEPYENFLISQGVDLEEIEEDAEAYCIENFEEDHERIKSKLQKEDDDFIISQIVDFLKECQSYNLPLDF